jgi:sterol desaturase/sphingolipid hydroxylase (fatty acid hydroxylase superfamily)
MPSPIELLLDPISLTVFTLYASLIAWEAIAPARTLPRVRGWRALGLAAFVGYFFLSSYLPLLWAEHLAKLQVLDLSSLGTWGGAIVGLLIYELGVYGWHRTMHASNVLWRVFHQMHHSAERLDTYGAFWFSPADMLGWTVLFSLCLTSVVGLAPSAVTVVLLTATLLSIFQHTNISTPRWLGYIVQRPESHSRHHARGIHTGNFSDLPVFDLLFGTFHNPFEFVAETGFYQGASRRLAEMLSFRDVSYPPPAAASTIDAQCTPETGAR